jgi:transmembrane sensor
MPDSAFNSTDSLLLARALANELNEDEMEAFRLWLEAEPARRLEYRRLQRLWADAGRLPRQWDAERALGAIRAQARAEQGPQATKTSFTRLRWGEGEALHRRWRWAASGLAAASVIAIGFGVISRPTHRTPPPRAATPIIREVSTKRGETAQLRFPDGTEIRLAPSSRLQYPGDMLGRSRDLDLEGEAYVIAGAHGHAPLVIHTQLGSTRDIGTRFVVRAFPRAPLAVVVVEGLVVLRPSKRAGGIAQVADSVLLRPRSLGTVSLDGELRERRGVSVENYVAWLDGHLVFADAPLREVLETLARWRAIDYRFADPGIEDRRFSGTFTSEPLPEILDLVALTTNVRFEHQGEMLVARDDPTRSTRSVRPPHLDPSAR